MRFFKQITALFLSFTLIACCPIFQADAFSSTTATTSTSWVVVNKELSSSHDVYNIKPKKAENIIGNNFSIFSFKCFIKQHKSVFATNYSQQKKLQLPQTVDYLKLTLQTSSSEDDSQVG